MEATTVWIIVWVSTLLLFSAGLSFFIWWRKRQDDVADEWDGILNLAQMVLEAVVKEAKKQLADIPLETVSASAGSVYDRYIADTAAAALIPRQFFVNLVMEKWQELVGVQALVASTHVTVMARLTASTAPPGGRA